MPLGTSYHLLSLIPASFRNHKKRKSREIKAFCDTKSLRASATPTTQVTEVTYSSLEGLIMEVPLSIIIMVYLK
jgi:hypothetical protein